MDLEARKKLVTVPATCWFFFEVKVQTQRIAHAPEKVSVAGNDERRSDRLVFVRHPDAVISLVFSDDGVQAFGAPRATEEHFELIRKRGGSKAVQRVGDNHSGRKDLRLPQRRSREGEVGRIGRETPTPSGGRNGRAPHPYLPFRKRSPPVPSCNQHDSCGYGAGIRTRRRHGRAGSVFPQIAAIASPAMAPSRNLPTRFLPSA